MAERSINHILRQLQAGETEAAWGQFLEEYSALIYQVVRHFESGGDGASDCFQFVCEQLVKDRFRRLRKFNLEGPATFATWLRAVVRNLCLDRRRKELGRLRLFRSVARLSALDQEVFRCVYERGHSREETALLLAPRYPGLTPDRVLRSVERIEQELTTNQRWRLGVRSRPAARGEATAPDEPHAPLSEAVDPRPDPEDQAFVRERRAALRRALGHLSREDILLLRLRFEEELTLEQVAQLLGLGNAQRADRQIKDVLARLRRDMNFAVGTGADGKIAATSVKQTVQGLAPKKWKKPN
ncbi:MAG TPA: sigma-70 family RNA polymerase sigma factor [Pyrinomonadaceae bacterium]